MAHPVETATDEATGNNVPVIEKKDKGFIVKEGVIVREYCNLTGIW